MGLATLEQGIERDYNGLEPSDYALISIEQRDFLERLGSFKAPYLEEKMMKQEDFRTSEEYQEA